MWRRLLAPETATLIRDGLVEADSEKDYPNPHIRPWPTCRSIDEQAADVEEMAPDSYGACLYPTAAALKRNRTRRKYPDEPYRQAMAGGRGRLELRYFETTVLEQYRNDPRFSFQYWDFGVNTVISDEAYLHNEELEKDKVIMSHIGFPDDLSGYDANDVDSPIVRRVCAFYGDLAKLSPEHQQRWKTSGAIPQEGLGPHPAWMDTQTGYWADGVGPLGRFMYELEAPDRPHEVPAHPRERAKAPYAPAEIARCKLGRIAATDEDGYSRVDCPAVLGKVRCPLSAARRLEGALPRSPRGDRPARALAHLLHPAHDHRPALGQPKDRPAPRLPRKGLTALLC